jgi:hypothetical protein
MVLADRNCIVKGQRIFPAETPLEGLMRLKRERIQYVNSGDIQDWMTVFFTNLRKANLRLKDASFVIHQAGAESLTPESIVQLVSNVGVIAFATVIVKKNRQGRISHYRGFPGPSIKGHNGRISSHERRFLEQRTGEGDQRCSI